MKIRIKTLDHVYLQELENANDSPWRIPSEKAGSWMAFFKKFSIDFNRAALWGIHCIPAETVCHIDDGVTIMTSVSFCVCLLHVPARGVFAVLLCAR